MEEIIKGIDSNTEWIKALDSVAIPAYIDNDGNTERVVTVVYWDLVEIAELLEDVKCLIQKNYQN